MGLYERLMNLEQPRIPVHYFYAAMTEFKRGQLSQGQVISIFNLSAGEQVEMATLITRVTGNFLTGPEIHEVLMLAEARYAGYDTVQAIKTRLGV